MKRSAHGHHLLDVPAKPDPRAATPPVASVTVDVRSLEHELRRSTEAEIRFTDGDRAIYSTGGSNYRQLPIGVVIPRSVDDVVETVRVCREHGAPVLPRGGGTSLAGQCCNVAVVLDFSKYLHRTLEIDASARLARVQPGLILDHLRDPAEQEYQLTFGPDPSTHDHCTFGGMIGNNSCGVRSVMAQFYGPGPRMSHNVHELEVLLYDGRRLRVGKGTSGDPEIDRRLLELRDRYAPLIRERYPDIPRRVSGYNLDDLLPENGFDVAAALTGTEGTCALVLEATVHLLPSPKHRSLLVLGWDSEYEAADHVMAVLEHKPTGLEGVDHVLIEDMRAVGLHPQDTELMPAGRGWLLVEFGGEDKDEADAKAHDLVRELKKETNPPEGIKLFDDQEQEQHVWEVREAGLGATAFIPGKPDTYEGWEDSAVPPERLGEYLRGLRKLAKKYQYDSALYGHYGQGCVHARWNFDLKSEPGIRKFRSFLDEASDLVLELGGSLSGEHGDGESRAELLPKMFGPELIEGFREFKSIWDPDWKMNPGKIVDAYRITDNLRLGPEYAPPKLKTHFAFAKDHGSFEHAALRCVGIGKCRRTHGGVMCPSYMVTREEKHTTRGRARMLWEMVNGEDLELWRSDQVLEALDLCLSCKGCTKDCPVSVDMPTLKSEFLSHHYEGRLRPRHAYAFGLIDQTARAASRVPALANLLTQREPFARVAKLAAGAHPERHLPPFARLTLRDWYAERGTHNPAGRKVILWPDTFTNHFHTDVGVAAVEALEDAGCRVVVPEGHLCCGRPLYDYGMLDLAGRYLERVLDALRDDIRAGTPVVGAEPSCVAVFKDELVKMRPNDEDAKRLSHQTYHLAEFLQEEGYKPPPLSRKAVLHEHCHQHATGGIDPDRKLLESMGVEVEVPDSGCCGMAGAWGYEHAHYDVSMACGERVLLPKVREAPVDALVVTAGFSCRSQIEHATPRRALHVAQVIQLARDHGASGPPGPYPERAAAPKPLPSRARRVTRATTHAALAAAVAGGVALAVARSRS
ncbi:MAG TPA: FAD-binding and (Fe-S)-binding domain-containing protein [Gaiellaceae bacterium]